MYLGVDLGTSGLRTILVDDAGTTLHAAENGYGVRHPAPGWSEQDPADWIKAFASAMDELVSARPDAMARIKAIGVSGHMHGATLIDAQGEILRPCILWNDTRAHAEAARLDSDPQFRSISGNIVFPGFTAPKLAWVAEHEPEVFARVAKVLLPKDYLNFWLTGRYVSEMSDAAGTGWLDVANRRWSDALRSASGMRIDQMPDLVEGSERAGRLRPELAKRWGLSDAVIIAGGGADNAAAACGVGALAEGRGFVSLGTSGVLLAARDRFAPSAESAVHTFCHAVPDRWYQMGVILAATDSLNWLARTLGASPAQLTDALGTTLEGPGSLRFLPYISGERTPHNDGAIRGAFLNIDVNTDRDAMTRAVIEGVGFALRDCLEALRSTGAAPQSLLAIGGGTASRYWTELLATILELPLTLPKSGELGAALGAARLAICAAGDGDPLSVMAPPPIAETIDPNAQLTAAFADAYQSHKASYPALKAIP